MCLTIAFFCLLGVFYGSFVGSYIIRFPKLIDAQSNVTIYSPRSRCEVCGATLKYYMLIPLLSYLIQRGRCLFCKRSISKFYFLNELFHLLLMASILWSGALPSNLESILIFLVIASLYAQFLIDLRHLALSLFFSGKILILGLILNGYFGLFTDIASSLMGAFAGYASLYLINKIYFLIRKREGIIISERNANSLKDKIEYVKKEYTFIQKKMINNQLPTKSDFIEDLFKILNQD